MVIVNSYAAEKSGEYDIQYPDLAAAGLLEVSGNNPEKLPELKNMPGFFAHDFQNKPVCCCKRMIFFCKGLDKGRFSRAIGPYNCNVFPLSNRKRNRIKNFFSTLDNGYIFQFKQGRGFFLP